MEKKNVDEEWISSSPKPTLDGAHPVLLQPPSKVTYALHLGQSTRLVLERHKDVWRWLALLSCYRSWLARLNRIGIS